MSWTRIFVDPTFRALQPNSAYMVATDTLTADNQKVSQLLKKSGPMGEQLLTKMAEMEQAGWKLKPLGFNDRYLQLEKPNLLSRFAKMGTLSGYHYDYFKGEQLRTVAYNNVANAMGGVLGSSYGTGNPVKRVTSILSHEVAHHDGTSGRHQECLQVALSASSRPWPNAFLLRKPEPFSRNYTSPTKWAICMSAMTRSRRRYAKVIWAVSSMTLGANQARPILHSGL